MISSKVQAVVDLYGPSDLTTDFAREYSSVRKLFDKSYSEDPVSYLKASPLNLTANVNLQLAASLNLYLAGSISYTLGAAAELKFHTTDISI